MYSRIAIVIAINVYFFLTFTILILIQFFSFFTFVEIIFFTVFFCFAPSHSKNSELLVSDDPQISESKELELV